MAIIRNNGQNPNNSHPTASAHRTCLTPITLPDLLAREFKPREFIIEPLIHERGLVMIFAWRGVGKTWFALGLAHAIASGGSFLKWTAKKAKRVVHVCGEMPAADLQERLKALTAASNASLPLPAFFRVLSADLHEFGIPDLASKEGQEAIEAVIGDADVVIFDNVATLFRGGQENESESWAPVQNWLLKLRREGRTIIIHHSNKSRAQRGTSKREDVLDLVLNLREPSGDEADGGARFEVHFEKARGITGDALRPFEAHLKIEDGVARWSIRAIEDARGDEIAELRAAGKSVREIASETGISRSTIQRALTSRP